MSGPTHWYRAYGLRIRSAVALPFDPLPDSGAFEPDVTVRLGAVPETLPACNGHSIRSNRWQARPGTFLMRVEDVARYLVTGGRDMLIDPLGTDDGDVVAFFASSPFTALLQQRGVVTLHAAAVTATARRVPVARMTRPRYPFLLDALADHVEAHLRERAAGGPEPRLPTPVHEETSILSALAHHHTPGESRQPATRSG